MLADCPPPRDPASGRMMFYEKVVLPVEGGDRDKGRKRTFYVSRYHIYIIIASISLELNLKGRQPSYPHRFRAMLLVAHIIFTSTRNSACHPRKRASAQERIDGARVCLRTSVVDHHEHGVDFGPRLATQLPSTRIPCPRADHVRRSARTSPRTVST